MHFLLTNDDGISSPLLHALCAAAAKRGHRVTVSAPATQQSAKSHAFTIFDPLLVTPAQVEGAQAAWAVRGMPVDSCRVGMMGLADAPVDMVLSGINCGWNVGFATFVSGTVGAAREAAFADIPAMALSMPYVPKPGSVEFFADYAIRAAERLADYPAPPKSVCSINMPDVTPDEVKPARVCPFNRNIYKDSYTRTVGPRGQIYYMLAPEEDDERPTPGCDVDLLRQGHITVTFLTPEGCRQEDYADFVEGL